MTTAVLETSLAQAAATAADIDVDVLEQAVTIALAGGPDETTPDWQKWASCAGVGPADYFPARGAPVHELMTKCRETCSVQAECLAAALASGEHHGVWGGTSAKGRLRLRNELRAAGLLGVVGEDAYIAWRTDGADREPTRQPARRVVATPWTHQAQAVESIVAELAHGGTCQVSMATASGKTHVAMWAAAEMGCDRILVLVPSLALVAQTAQVWRADARWAETPMLAVCSDIGATEMEATTDPFVVVDFVFDSPSSIVFATYQSSQVLVDADARFDLTIADEAHHLAGAADKAFATVLRREIPTDRTLYMTATPRRFTRRRASDDIDLVSMDDDAFGPRVYELLLSDAVDAGVVADYRVIVAAVDRQVFDRVAGHSDLEGTDPHLLAGAIAVVEAMGNLHLTSCVSFHTRVERARSFSRLVGAVAEILPGLAPEGPGWAGFVHGDASVRIRERLLARLGDQHTWGVLANAKALGEGVDLPELDAVAIVDPKNSEIDVLQATGRALRRPAGTTKVGTILLPVLLEGDADPDDLMAGIDERSMDLVAGVLRSLRSHDVDLGSRLDRTRRATARTGVTAGLGPADLSRILRERAARGLLQSRVELNLPDGPLCDLAGAMALHLVREATSTWDEAFGRLQAWTAEHGHCRIPQSAEVAVLAGASSSLGSWTSRQRTLHRRGLLAPERVKALEGLPRWSWDARTDTWWEKFDILADYIATYQCLPKQSVEHHGAKIGQFLATCRAAMKDYGGNWLSQFPDRIAALETLPGWSWNERDDWWEGHFAQLQQWAAEHGHAAPSAGDSAPDGFDLGKWVAKERGKVRSGKRTPDQSARLRALPGWVDDFHEIGAQLWEDGYARLAAHITRHGELPIQTHKEADGFNLGGWVSKQRQAHRGQRGAGLLTAERISRLESLPHWTWTPKVGFRQAAS